MSDAILDSNTQSTDRLSFTIFVALAFHALIVFGCTFVIDDSANVAPTLNITLATHKNDEPEKADFLAQQNQQASGTEESAKELTTNQQAEIADTQINQVNPTPQTRKIVKSDEQRKIVQAVRNDQQQVTRTTDLANEEKLDPTEGLDAQAMAASQKAASLKARHDQQKQQYAKIPRIMRMTSVATKASEDARYLLDWTQKIETIGQAHFPREAISQGIEGDLRLAVSLLPNGHIDGVEILHSSGHSVLDDAAMQIVRLASPFAPLPKNMRANYDKLEIIRTWQFRSGGLTTR